MASRTARKPTARKRNATAYMSTYGGLPGALFLGAVVHAEGTFANRHFENVALAERLQEIRADYEEDGFEEMLWADCPKMALN
jgi:hypothetical protein